MDPLGDAVLNGLKGKLGEKKAEEENMEKSCKELTAQYKETLGKKMDLFGELVQTFVAYPRGQIALNYILKETTDRCDTLLNCVVEQEKVSEAEEFAFPTPNDQYTMMPFFTLESELQKVKEENDELKSELSALMADSTKDVQFNDMTCKEIIQQTRFLGQYLTEMRAEHENLEQELQLQNNNQKASANIAQIHPEGDTMDITLSGLEEQINDVYGSDSNDWV